MIGTQNKRPVALITTVALLLSSIVVPVRSLHADDTVIFTQSFPPNLLLILDRSGSMHFRTDGTGQGNSGNVNVDCMDTLGNATNDGTNGCAPFAERRITIAVDALKKLLDRNGDGSVTSADTTAGPVNFRFGYMRFIDPDFSSGSDGTTWNNPPKNNPGGGGQLETIGNYQAGSVRIAGGTHADHSDVATDYERLWYGWPGNPSCTKNDNWNGCVGGVSSPQARGATPLAAALEEARRYFSGYTIFSPEKGPTTPPDGGPNGPDPAISGDTGRSCRLQYAILITDGADTLACNGNGSESQSDQARRRRASATAARDLHRAGVKLFVIGFGSDMPIELQRTLNWMAWYGGSDNPDVSNSPADPSTVRINDGQINAPCNANAEAQNDPGAIALSGYAFFAQNATQLTDAINKAVTIITQEVATFTSPTVATVRTTDSNKVYLASFKPKGSDSFWPGNLKGFELDSSGAPIGAPIWSGVGAGEILESRDPSSRRIYTIDGTEARMDFTKLNNTTLTPLVGYTLTTDTDTLIDYIRGVTNRDGSTPASPGRWKLGDIFHSNPKVAGPPSATYAEPYDTNDSYGTFRNQSNIKTRKKVIYTGANEGTLHAFDAGTFQGSSYDNGTGAELWAFIPPFQDTISPTSPFLSKLQATLTSTHTFFVDGSPRVTDVWWGTNNTAKSASEWRTVLIAGQRKGGRYYAALDVTDPANLSYPSYLWSFTDNNLGETWSEPAIGKVKIENTDGTVLDRWVAIVGGGYDVTKDPGFAKSNPLALSPSYVAPTDAAPGVSNAIFIIDIATGKRIWEFTYLSTDSQRKFLQYGFPSSPAAVDTNGDGYLDWVYIGDLGGQMWRLDISAIGETSSGGSILSTTPIGIVANWTGARLFSNSTTINDPPSDPAHPIYFPPSVAFNSKGELFVFFGTGDRENNIKNDDPAVTTNDRFYGVKDSYAGGTVPPVTLASELQSISATSTATFNPTSFPKGWYLFFGNNEKAISGSTLFAGILFFPTFLPVATSDPCLMAGDSFLYAVNFETVQGQFASDGTILKASDTSGISKRQSLGAGTGIASTPVISIGDPSGGDSCGAQVMMTTTSGGGGFATSGGAAGVISTCTPTPNSMVHIRSWRQL